MVHPGGRPKPPSTASHVDHELSDSADADHDAKFMINLCRRFHYAIIRPNRAAITRRRGAEVWARSLATFHSQVLGPHFDAICREALLDMELGLPPVSEVGATTLHDPTTRIAHEVTSSGPTSGGG